MYLIRISVIALLLLTPTLGATAQFVSVSGRVTHDQTGNPQSRIPLYLLGTSLAAFTDSSGDYVFREVPPGSYELVAVFPDHRQIKQILQVAGDADIVHDIAVPFEVSVADEPPAGERSDSQTSPNNAPTQRTDVVSPEVETVCSCYNSAVSLLDQALDLRGKFATEAAYKADDAAGEEMESLLGEWSNLQRQCLSRFGTKLFEESACNKPTEISRKRQALNDSGIRS
ncbi:MAG: carboxypeptidase-like regulatory domain-containing protein [Rhodothermales bacterium]